MTLLETRNLSKSFGGLQAIDKVSLKVEQNTIHGLIGPNGSGKSTFFNLLTGVYQPDEGSHISFDGSISPTARHMPSPVWGWPGPSSCCASMAS